MNMTYVTETESLNNNIPLYAFHNFQDCLLICFTVTF